MTGGLRGRCLQGLVALVVCLALAGCGKDDKGGGNTKLTKANFEKVKDGMTEKEVVDLLGTPTETKNVDKDKHLIWKGGNNSVNVVLDKDGKVTGRTSMFIEVK